MKRIVSAAVTAVLAAGLGLAVPAAASAAVPASVVTSAEFFKVTQGNSIEFVRKTFGNNGKVIDRYDPPGYGEDYVKVAFPTYYAGGTVEVEFLRRSSGTWYLVSKWADWGNKATQTADKATEAEFNKVKQGNTIAYVRSTFGTNGTITQYFDAPGTEYDGVAVEWPTASADGWVQIAFVKSSSGVWKVDARVALWDVAPRQTADKATEAEFNKVKPGNSIDYARSTFGTAGTINYYFDEPGTANDAVWLLWPTESPDGWVNVDFTKSSAGVWKAVGRWADWARTAEPTEDLATHEEFLTIATSDTLTDVRHAFGTPGTIVYYADDLGTEDDVVVVNWYTGPDTGDVSVTFWKTLDGWMILNAEDMSGPWGDAPTARTFSESPEPAAPELPVGKAAPARPSWDPRTAH